MMRSVDRIAAQLVGAGDKPAPTNLRLVLAWLRDQGEHIIIKLVEPEELQQLDLFEWNMRSGSGAVSKDRNPRIILLNRAHSEHRIRFTLAHELAHIIYEILRINDPDEEFWCDELANAILVPHARLMNFAWERQSLYGWNDGNRTFWVSPDVFWRAAWAHLRVAHIASRSGRIYSSSMRPLSQKIVAQLAEYELGARNGRRPCDYLLFINFQNDLLGDWEGIIQEVH